MAKRLVPQYTNLLEICKSEAVKAPGPQDGNLVKRLKLAGAFPNFHAKKHALWLAKYNVFRTNLNSKLVRNVVCDATKQATRENDVKFLIKLGKNLSRPGLELQEDTPPSDWEFDKLDMVILANWVTDRHPLKLCFISDMALFALLKSEAKDVNPTADRVRNCIKKLKLKRPIRPAPIRHLREMNGEMYFE